MTRRDEDGPIPCQVGTLAQLRRVDPAHAGRIVLVEGPPTTVRVPGKAFPLLAWRVSVMGRDLELDDRMVSDFIVPEICLRPLCLLDTRSARALSRAKAQHDADAAIEQLRRALEEHPMDDAELDLELDSAAREALARHAAPPVLLPLGRN
jgi:hypothetical protein